MALSTFRLTIWRPFRSDRDLHYAVPSSAPESFPAFAPTKLHEAIYIWSPEQDVLAGVSDEDLRSELRTLLFASFAPGLPPEERTFAKLAQTVERLERLTHEDPASNWTDTVQLDGQDEDSSCALRCTPTAALYQRLNWLLEVFGKVPGLSVMIR